jgi:hypothetical protein
MKFPSNPDYQEEIRKAKTVALAKKMGKTKDVVARSDWMKTRDDVMLEITRVKFAKDPLKSKLLETGDALIRDMSPQDNYWGIGRSGRGTNKLGKILMQVRKELQESAGVNAVAEVASASVSVAQIPSAFEAPVVEKVGATPAPEVVESNIVATANDALLEPLPPAPAVPVATEAPVTNASETVAPEPPSLTVETEPQVEFAPNENIKVIKI